LPYIPNEVMVDVLQYLARNELDVMEMVDRRMDALVGNHCAHILRRDVYCLEISHRGYDLTLSEDGRRVLHVDTSDEFIALMADVNVRPKIRHIRYINALSIPRSFPPSICLHNMRLEVHYLKDVPWVVHRIRPRVDIQFNWQRFGPQEPFPWIIHMIEVDAPGRHDTIHCLKPFFRNITVKSHNFSTRMPVEKLLIWLNYEIGTSVAEPVPKKLVMSRWMFDYGPGATIKMLSENFLNSGPHRSNTYEIVVKKVSRKNDGEYPYLYLVNDTKMETFRVYPLQEEWEDEEGNEIEYHTWVIRRGPVDVEYHAMVAQFN